VQLGESRATRCTSLSALKSNLSESDLFFLSFELIKNLFGFLFIKGRRRPFRGRSHQRRADLTSWCESIARSDRRGKFTHRTWVDNRDVRCGHFFPPPPFKEKYLKHSILATRVYASQALERTGIPSPVAGYVTSDDVTRGKPQPEPYLAGAQRIGVDPKNCTSASVGKHEDEINGQRV
jgi:hypothetical protein